MKGSIELVKIDASLIGIKEPIEVKTSNKNVKRAIIFLRDAAQADADNDSAKNVIQQMNAILKGLDAAEGFVVDILKLSKSQKERLEDLSNDEFTDFAANVAETLMGVSSDSEATQNDQKSN